MELWWSIASSGYVSELVIAPKFPSRDEEQERRNACLSTLCGQAKNLT